MVRSGYWDVVERREVRKKQILCLVGVQVCCSPSSCEALTGNVQLMVTYCVKFSAHVLSNNSLDLSALDLESQEESQAHLRLSLQYVTGLF